MGAATRPKGKQSKFMLCGHYGPTAAPRFRVRRRRRRGGGKEIKVQVQSAVEVITDLGPIAGIDAAKAFGIEAEDIALAEQVSAAKRVDSGKQTYYHGAGPAVGEQGFDQRLRPTADPPSPREATADSGPRAAALRGARDAFTVPVVAESTTDLSNRIYNNASDGGSSERRV